jgi:hypothetical protein
MPSVATDPNGGVHVSWFDTRLSGGTTSSYAIFATRSVDGDLATGAAFSKNLQVSPSINAGSASFIGDYGGIAAIAGSAHAVWTNGGFNGGLLQTAALGF